MKAIILLIISFNYIYPIIHTNVKPTPENKGKRDSAYIFFETGFSNTKVVIYCNKKKVFDSIITSDEVSGLASTFSLEFKRHITSVDVYIADNYLKVDISKERPYIGIELNEKKASVFYSSKPPGFD